jgi:hypothetical protein
MDTIIPFFPSETATRFAANWVGNPPYYSAVQPFLSKRSLTLNDPTSHSTFLVEESTMYIWNYATSRSWRVGE